MARARAGAAEANIAFGGPVSAKLKVWVFNFGERFSEKQILKHFKFQCSSLGSSCWWYIGCAGRCFCHEGKCLALIVITN